MFNGSYCPGEGQVTISCYGALAICPQLGEWSAWSQCDCQTMKQNRTRACNIGPPYDILCHGSRFEEQQCFSLGCTLGKYRTWNRNYMFESSIVNT